MKRLAFIAFSIFSIQLLVSSNQSASAAQTLTIIAEDSLNYSGNIVGQSGGSGFTGSWATHYGVSDYSIQTPGLTYSGLTTSGGYMYACSATPNTVCGVSRDIPAQNSDAIYIQFLAQFTTQTGGGTPNIRLYDAGNNLSGGIGANGGSSISIFDSGFNTSAQASAGALNSLSFIIVKIDYKNNLTSMWINPNLATFSYYTPPTPDAKFENLAAQVKTLAFYARAGVKYDELKIYKLSGTTAAEDDAAAAAEKKKAEEDRAARIQAARMALTSALETGKDFTTQMMLEADVPFSHKEIMLAYFRELKVIQSKLTAPLSEPEKTSTKTFVANKYVNIEKITTALTPRIFARDLVRYGLISANTPQKTRIVSALALLPVESRATMEEASAFCAKEVQTVIERRARLAARLGQS